MASKPAHYANHGVKRVHLSAAALAKKKESEHQKIQDYTTLCTALSTLRTSPTPHTREALDLTTNLLTYNPEYYSTWNYRREILATLFTEWNDSEIVKQLEKEMRFGEGCLRSHPKVYWIWNHRGWVFAQYPSSTQAPWRRELGLVNAMLGLDPRNFHGWNYRRTVLRHIESQEQRGMEEEEWAYTSTHIQKNLSNFSAWHHRASLIPKLLSRGQNLTSKEEVLAKELDLLHQAIYTDPADSSSWIYHQYLLSSLTKPADSMPSLTPMDVGEKIELLRAEIGVIQELSDMEPEEKWPLLSLVHYKQMLAELSGDADTDEEGKHEIREMLQRLKEIDPLRKGRYEYWEQKL
ncbi:protein prenylyltransferase [Saitoella complicata NRRL Y-17804]|uniref:protein prenylyltransferase n=1 Tax=Saitoella complicata (strain BCRC 22490 / CBS 7301 / JCM 7358 / NBRC 10748 / NRRL Y-17804) TaxID=698492 RepID=UPI000867BEEE|nr:protein prenylyltransferase [Saitoella complicata NRRL Y-17804]ODQ55762.1 protein prenylyltransferase [Saitoella complicata NRRL Y-17804]